eukprot:COSAG01_NODE_9188_length_2526_cov_143.636176_2_plen_176_part_00
MSCIHRRQGSLTPVWDGLRRHCRPSAWRPARLRVCSRCMVLLLLGTVAAAAAAAAGEATGEATVSRVAVAAAGAAHAVCLIERRERWWRRRGSGTTCASDETDRPTTPACGPPTVVHACMLGCQAFAHDEGLPPPPLLSVFLSVWGGGRWLTAVTVGGSRPGAGRCLQAVASWVN